MKFDIERAFYNPKESTRFFLNLPTDEHGEVEDLGVVHYPDDFYFESDEYQELCDSVFEDSMIQREPISTEKTDLNENAVKIHKLDTIRTGYVRLCDDIQKMNPDEVYKIAEKWVCKVTVPMNEELGVSKIYQPEDYEKPDRLFYYLPQSPPIQIEIRKVSDIWKEGPPSPPEEEEESPTLDFVAALEVFEKQGPYNLETLLKEFSQDASRKGFVNNETRMWSVKVHCGIHLGLMLKILTKQFYPHSEPLYEPYSESRKTRFLSQDSLRDFFYSERNIPPKARIGYHAFDVKNLSLYMFEMGANDNSPTTYEKSLPNLMFDSDYKNISSSMFKNGLYANLGEYEKLFDNNNKDIFGRLLFDGLQKSTNEVGWFSEFLFMACFDSTVMTVEQARKKIESYVSDMDDVYKVGGNSAKIKKAIQRLVETCTRIYAVCGGFNIASCLIANVLGNGVYDCGSFLIFAQQNMKDTLFKYERNPRLNYTANSILSTEEGKALKGRAIKLRELSENEQFNLLKQIDNLISKKYPVDYAYVDHDFITAVIYSLMIRFFDVLPTSAGKSVFSNLVQKTKSAVIPQRVNDEIFKSFTEVCHRMATSEEGEAINNPSSLQQSEETPGHDQEPFVAAIEDLKTDNAIKELEKEEQEISKRKKNGKPLEFQSKVTAFMESCMTLFASHFSPKSLDSEEFKTQFGTFHTNQGETKNPIIARVGTWNFSIGGSSSDEDIFKSSGGLTGQSKGISMLNQISQNAFEVNAAAEKFLVVSLFMDSQTNKPNVNQASSDTSEFVSRCKNYFTKIRSQPTGVSMAEGGYLSMVIDKLLEACGGEVDMTFVVLLEAYGRGVFDFASFLDFIVGDDLQTYITKDEMKMLTGNATNLLSVTVDKQRQMYVLADKLLFRRYESDPDISLRLCLLYSVFRRFFGLGTNRSLRIGDGNHRIGASREATLLVNMKRKPDFFDRKGLQFGEMLLSSSEKTSINTFVAAIEDQETFAWSLKAIMKLMDSDSETDNKWWWISTALLVRHLIQHPLIQPDRIIDANEIPERSKQMIFTLNFFNSTELFNKALEVFRNSSLVEKYSQRMKEIFSLVGKENFASGLSSSSKTKGLFNSNYVGEILAELMDSFSSVSSSSPLSLVGFLNCIWVASNHLVSSSTPTNGLWESLSGYNPEKKSRVDGVLFSDQFSMPLTWFPNPMMASSCGSDCLFIPQLSTESIKRDGWVQLGWTHLEKSGVNNVEVSISPLNIRIGTSPVFRDKMPLGNLLFEMANEGRVVMDYVVKSTDDQNEFSMLVVNLSQDKKEIELRECSITPYSDHVGEGNFLSKEYFVQDVQIHTIPITSENIPSIIKITESFHSLTAGFTRVSCVLGGYQYSRRENVLGYLTMDFCLDRFQCIPDAFVCDWAEGFRIEQIQKRALDGVSVIDSHNRIIPLIIITPFSSQTVSATYTELDNNNDNKLFKISFNPTSKNFPTTGTNVGMVTKSAGGKYHMEHLTYESIEEAVLEHLGINHTEHPQTETPLIYLNKGTRTVVSSLKAPLVIVELGSELTSETKTVTDQDGIESLEEIITEGDQLNCTVLNRTIIEVSERLKLFYEPMTGIIFFFTSWGFGYALSVGERRVNSIIVRIP